METEQWWMGPRVRVLADSKDRENWLEVRRRYFTGSEAATLLGKHEYTKLDKVLAEKRTGESDFDGSQDHVVQGLLSEQFVAAYTEHCYQGLKLDPCGLLLADPACGKLAATPDYVTQSAAVWGYDAPANVQLKFTMAGSDAPSGMAHPAPRAAWPKTKGFRWGEDGSIPSYIAHQVQLEAACLGMTTSFVVAYHRFAAPRFGTKDHQIRVYRVDANPELLADLRAAAERTPLPTPPEESHE